MKPNLFKYATSELSQDAIICWLLEWAKPENKNENTELHQVGKLFLDSLFDKFDDKETPNQYNTIKIIKQYKDIDVFCVVNEKYALIIEDKTNTKDHSGQLDKYFKEINKKYDKSKIFPIYFKTGDQSNYSKIIDKDYKIYLRKDFLALLDNPFKSDILEDYKSHLQKIEDSVNSYKTVEITSWNRNAIKGFYLALQKELGEGHWDYVANPSGGFLGFWWNKHQLDEYKIYMQIEQVKIPKKSEESAKRYIPQYGFVLKFKLSSGTKEKVDKSIINKWKKHIINDTPSIKKPRVVRAGRWTTIGLMNEDFIAIDENRKVCISKTVENLKKIEQVLKDKVDTAI
ncbi:MAG: hypothetical protein DRQ78_03900 [Epsilonproteobacteria bacterium]|nr:MAG: hypothetical protein DRQ78_03900 [Campylobacterota bacterium]